MKRGISRYPRPVPPPKDHEMDRLPPLVSGGEAPILGPVSVSTPATSATPVTPTPVVAPSPVTAPTPVAPPSRPGETSRTSTRPNPRRFPPLYRHQPLEPDCAHSFHRPKYPLIRIGTYCLTYQCEYPPGRTEGGSEA